MTAINNMVYGQDPRQGFIEENAFYHPVLRFFFSFPESWQVQNTPAQVTLASEDGKAGVILKAEKTSENLKDYANGIAAKIENAEFIEEKSITINGLASYHQVYDISKQEGGNLRTRLSYLKKNGFIYTFLALSAQDEFSQYDRSFQSIVGSFQELRNAKYLNREPMRISLVTANGRENLQAIFQKAGMVKDLWPTFAIMNGAELDSTPDRGQTIKIAR